MGFWIFIFIVDMLIPATMIGFGRMFTHKAPETINWAFGYRTSMSMKNQETWNFAHKYAGSFWLKWGKRLAVITLLVMFFLIGRDADTVGNIGGALCMLQLVPLIYVIVPTEQALKKHFDAKGNRRKPKVE